MTLRGGFGVGDGRGDDCDGRSGVVSDTGLVEEAMARQWHLWKLYKPPCHTSQWENKRCSCSFTCFVGQSYLSKLPQTQDDDWFKKRERAIGQCATIAIKP